MFQLMISALAQSHCLLYHCTCVYMTSKKKVWWLLISQLTFYCTGLEGSIWANCSQCIVVLWSFTCIHIQPTSDVHEAYLCKWWQNGTRCRDGVKVLWCHSLHAPVSWRKPFCDFHNYVTKFTEGVWTLANEGSYPRSEPRSKAAWFSSVLHYIHHDFVTLIVRDVMSALS